jgi:hypothetical protein
LEVSAALKTPNPKSGYMKRYLEDMSDLFIFLGAITRTIHPEQFYASLNGLRHLSDNLELTRDSSQTQEILDIWPSPYNGMQIICNRQTPLHRDIQGRIPWYDLLLTVGNYDNGRMDLPGIGMRLVYNPGTLVGLCGKLLVHGVSPVKGDRICFAQFMRDNVMTQVGVNDAGYSTVTNIVKS